MTFDWSIPFIGREDELNTIQAALQDWGTRRILFILGEGGVGKTRLLHELEPRFASTERIKMLSVIDFDDNQYKFPQNVGIAIGRQLDPTLFDPYLEALRKMHLLEDQKAEEENVAALVRRQTLTVNRCFIECFNEVSHEQRIVLRIDTTDALQDAALLDYVYELVSHLSNVLVVIAGRDVDTWFDTYHKELKDDARLIELQPFTVSNSRAYFEAKQRRLNMSLDQTWIEKLFLLTGGLPVLIDLAIEWTQRERPFDIMEQHSLADLQALQQRTATDATASQDLKDIQEAFKKAVVMPIARLDTPFDHLNLILAKVYPLDFEGVMEMMNLDSEETQRLLREARKSVAIKTLPDGRIKLHDEVQRLINTYVWPGIDQDSQWEIRDSRRAITYLTRKTDGLLTDIRQIKSLEQKQAEHALPEESLKIYSALREKEGTFWSLRLDLLRRQLAINVQQGYELFMRDRQLARKEASSLSYRQGLLHVISPYADLEQPKKDVQDTALDEAQRLSVQRKLARQATFDGMYDRAAEIYRRLLPKVPKEGEEYLKILNGQANQLVRAGKLQEAIRIHEQVLRLSKERQDPNWIVTSLLEIGWVNRLMGHLGPAQQYYQDALHLAFEHDDEDQIAQLYTSLAYVHAFEHKGKAVDEIQQAIRLWKKLLQEKEENRFHLGQCYNTAGEIYLEMERPEESLAYFDRSWSIFTQEERDMHPTEHGRSEWRSKARSGRGFAYWQLAVQALRKDDPDAARLHLQDARQDLEWAIKGAAEFDSPGILNRLGEVYFLLKDYNATEDTWMQSMNEARQVGDVFTELHSLSDLARLAFYHEVKKFPDWNAFEHWYKHQYRRQYQQAYFSGMVGLFYTYLGHLAFQREELKDTVTLYERGLPPLADSLTYAPFNLSDQLEFAEREIFPHIKAESIHIVGAQLKEHWISGMHDIMALTYFREWSRWKATHQHHARRRKSS